MPKWESFPYFPRLIEIFSYCLKGVDEAVDLVAGHVDDMPLTAQEARHIRNKIDWVILPLIFSLYTRKYIVSLRDIVVTLLIHFYPNSSVLWQVRLNVIWVKLVNLFNIYSRGALGASAVLGIIEDNHLTADQFNTLGSAFYIGGRSTLILRRNHGTMILTLSRATLSSHTRILWLSRDTRLPSILLPMLYYGLWLWVSIAHAKVSPAYVSSPWF